MARGVAKRVPHTLRHRDGSLWAKGYMKGEVMDGPWKWYRKDGTLMRSGAFKEGVQVGKWVTCDSAGRIVKVTLMPAKATQ